jgi:hypothetical protein
MELLYTTGNEYWRQRGSVFLLPWMPGLGLTGSPLYADSTDLRSCVLPRGQVQPCSPVGWHLNTCCVLCHPLNLNWLYPRSLVPVGPPTFTGWHSSFLPTPSGHHFAFLPATPGITLGPHWFATLGEALLCLKDPIHSPLFYTPPAVTP